jgi:hypothetical protein
LVTVAAGLTVTAGGLSVSAGSATITTTTSDGASESALVVSASDSSYQGKVLSVVTATAEGINFYLFEVRPLWPIFCIMHQLSKGLWCCCEVLGM